MKYEEIPEHLKAYKTEMDDPDSLYLDGHLFCINYNVPEEITQQLEELYNRNVKYDEIPEHLKAYEAEMRDSQKSISVMTILLH